MSRLSLRASLFLLVAGPWMGAQAGLAQAPATEATAGKPVVFTTRQDHEDMLRQLGIRRLRPGRDANEKAPQNAANYDESKANPYPELPPLLTTAGGETVTSPELWWSRRRPARSSRRSVGGVNLTPF